MSKRIKNLVAKELEKRLQGTESLVVIDYIGISANDANKLRTGLRQKKVRLTVVPNSQAKRALKTVGISTADSLLIGTNALVYGGESIVDLVKELVNSKKEIEKLVIKGSVVEGQFLNASATEALAKMPNKRELKGQIVGQALGPGRKLAGQIIGPGSNIAGVIKAVIEKREKETPAAAA